MSSIKDEVKKNLYQRCKCCLENDHLRDMWAEYQRDGEIEVYGEMLKECYEFPWIEPDKLLEHICERCIERLRSSLSFRRDILAAKEVLDQLVEKHTVELQLKTEILIESTEPTIKEEILEQEEEKLDPSLGENVCNESRAEEQAEFLTMDDDDDDEYKPDETDMEIEFLDEDAEEAETAASAVKRKWPKKKKKADRVKTYKQYTQEDMELAVTAVVANKMSRAEAADKHSVPLKTLGFKIRQREMDDSTDCEAKKKQMKFFDEIRTILDYTNATPYKTKIGRLFCAYCSTEGPNFESADALRTHTRTKHKKNRLREVEVFMRPYYLNEILKLDIENLHCTVCVSPIKDWSEMFEHLKDTHNIELDFAYTRVIPFVLGEDVVCCLCRQTFPHFHMLDSHMNSHYVNYMCGECGDSFLSENRLKKHVEIHSTKQYPCAECNKVFSLEKYRNKHYYGVHLKQRKFKCKHCPEAFSQEYTRHLHTVEKHNDKVKKISCEHCCMTFTWRPYYLKHLLRCHTPSNKKHKCKKCGKEFILKNELKNHEDWHIGKGFTCLICDRKFSSKSYLQKHKASAHGDEVGTSFVVVIEDDEKPIVQK